MKNRFSKKMTLVAVGAALSITSCKHSPYPGYEQTETGNYAKFYRHDEKGIKPKEGDIIRIYLAVKTDKDSILSDSKNPKYNNPGLNYYEFPLTKPMYKGSFEDALATMALGDSASFLISVDSMFKGDAKKLPAFLTKGSNVTYEVSLIKITPKEEAEKIRQKKMEEQKVMMELRKTEESKTFAKYLADNKITAKPTASGLYYIEKTKGKGAKPAAGCSVKVNYAGRLMDGKVFDTNIASVAKEAGSFDERRPYQPIDFVVGQGQVIKGWDEGLMLMSPGTKAQFIIPSSLGYGEQGNGPIPPFSPLVFEVELVSFTAPAGK